MSRIVALTGATGFVGTRVARRLCANGWRVRGLRRRPSEDQSLGATSISWIDGTLENERALNDLVDGVYAVVNCAGAVRGVDLDDFRPANIEGVANLARIAARQPEPPRFLTLSSLAAREPHLSPYALSKLRGEEALADIAGSMACTVFRPPAIYGPGDREMLPLLKLMAKGVAPILGPTSARFSVIYVDDLVNAIQRWLELERRVGGVFELHDGRENGYSWDDVVNIAAQYRGGRVVRVHVPMGLLRGLGRAVGLAGKNLGFAPFITLGKVRELQHDDWVCDNEGIVREMGWRPAVPFAEGFKRTLAVNAANTSLGTDLP